MTVSVQYKIEISENLTRIFSEHASAVFAKHRQDYEQQKVTWTEDSVTVRRQNSEEI